MQKNIKQCRAVLSIVLAAGLMIFCFSSCKKSDWFDIKSDKTLVIPTTVSDMQALLDNSLMNWNYPGLGETGSDDHVVPDANIANLSPKELNAYTWSHDQPNLLEVDWGTGNDGPYQRIYYANLVLDGLKKLTPGSTQYNDVKGQALLHRAFNFYALSQVFAPQYNAATAGSDLGIPLRLEADVNIPSKRATVAATYDQILNDLKEALPLLPDVPAYKTRGSKAAASAILARVYLTMGNYAQAATYANSALQINSTLLNYNDFNPAVSPIFPIYGKEVIMHASVIYSSVYGLVDPALYKLYADNDLRKTLYFKLNADQSVATAGTYFYTTGFNGPTIDEMYLVRAEGYARTGKVTEAMTDLNNLLRTRYKTGTYTDVTATSADDALAKILTERRKELVNRALRWTDLRRLNTDDRFKKTLTRVVKGKTYTLEPNTFKYTFPIPDDIISISGIQQNTGW